MAIEVQRLQNTTFTVTLKISLLAVDSIWMRRNIVDFYQRKPCGSLHHNVLGREFSRQHVLVALINAFHMLQVSERFRHVATFRNVQLKVSNLLQIILSFPFELFFLVPFGDELLTLQVDHQDHIPGPVVS